MTHDNEKPARGSDRDGLDQTALSIKKPRAKISTKRKHTKAEPSSNRDETPSSQTDIVPDPRPESGKSGETGGDGGQSWSHVSNAEFIAAIVDGSLPEGVFAAVCTKHGDPQNTKYPARRWYPGDDPGADGALNAYLNCGVFRYGADGSFRTRIDRSAGVLALMLDDIGTKVPLERLAGVTPTWRIETSQGNHQVGFAFAALVDGDIACRILEGLIDAGLCDPGSKQPKVRWARLPRGINGKPKHTRDEQPWQCRLVEWNPHVRFTPEDIIDAFDLELPPAGDTKRGARKAKAHPKRGERVFEEARGDNAVIAALQARGLYKAPLGDGKHDITCPLVSEHTDALDSGTAYFEASEEYPIGGFKCQHSHGDRLSASDLLEYLGVSHAAASGQALIRVLPGELHRIVAASEELLASDGSYFQRGNPAHIVRVVQRAGGASITVSSEEGLLLALSKGARWERWDMRSEKWAVCDPPPRHVKTLWRGGKFVHLLPLEGLARQPFFAPDGALVCEPGYHAASKRFALFAAADYVFPSELTSAAAEQALSLMLGLLDEFAFVAEHDRSAAIAAMLTAAARTSLPLAPAVHIRAPEYGSGKSFLADLIALIAAPTPQDVTKMTYPASSEEATKAILAALLPGPAVICFDDMQTDWTPFGAILRMLTSEWQSDRVLQESRIASASTRVLVLGTGNNVGPIADMLRRVNVIHLDHGEERPATKSYKSDPVAEVTRDRGRYISAALTIIAAYRAAGSPKANCKALAGYGAWTDACRQPLMWLGLPDPATRMFQNMQNDAGRDTIGALFEAWHKAFGDAPTTVRAAIKLASHSPSSPLFEAFDDLDVVERREINAKRLGWALKRASGRIACGFILTPVPTDGRQGWRVTRAEERRTEAPVSPVPPVFDPDPEMVAKYDADNIVYATDRADRRGRLCAPPV
jgi:hypothetical protein